MRTLLLRTKLPREEAALLTEYLDDLSTWSRAEGILEAVREAECASQLWTKRGQEVKRILRERARKLKEFAEKEHRPNQSSQNNKHG